MSRRQPSTPMPAKAPAFLAWNEVFVILCGDEPRPTAHRSRSDLTLGTDGPRRISSQSIRRGRKHAHGHPPCRPHTGAGRVSVETLIHSDAARRWNTLALVDQLAHCEHDPSSAACSSTTRFHRIRPLVCLATSYTSRSRRDGTHRSRWPGQVAARHTHRDEADTISTCRTRPTPHHAVCTYFVGANSVMVGGRDVRAYLPTPPRLASAKDSIPSHGLDRVDPRRPPGRNPARGEREQHQHRCCAA